MKHHAIKLTGLLVLSLGGLVAGLAVGSSGWSLPWQADVSAQADGVSIVWSLRWPRSMGAWLVGVLLGLAGALAQGVFRNPLADPFLLGSASGSAAAVAVALVVGSVLGLDGAWMAVSTGMAAFLGAWLAVLLASAIAGGASRPMPLLVAGIAVGVLFGAVREALTLVRPDLLQAMQAYMLGSTSTIDSAGLWVLGSVLLVCAGATWRLVRPMDAMAIGDNTAQSLGVQVSRTRTLGIALMALATAAAVAYAGLVAFVGLAAPHIARRLGFVRNAMQLPVAALVGGVLLLWADVVSRAVSPPLEWPVGLVTSILGGVYLLVLIRRGPASVQGVA
jgi:iron complex transport system permease protein